jgi:excinuclease ABC subunit A
MIEKIHVSGARVHNLKDVSVTIPRNAFVVFTGLSGSGKSSLAFDTIYAEGQRRYMESLSAYARQFLDQLDKPDVDRIEGLSPAISIDQKSSSHNPRSTVGTVTEIYDYFRILYASIGKPHCYSCGRPIEHQSVQEMIDFLQTWPQDTEILILAPMVSDKKGEFRQIFEQIKRDGFSRVRVDGVVYRIDDTISMDRLKKHNIDIVVDKITINADNTARLFESLETALRQSKGLVMVEKTKTSESHLFSELFSCPHCNISIPEISPRLFSFNSPVGACPTCNGLGNLLDFDLDLVVTDKDIPLSLCTQKIVNLDRTIYGRMAEKGAQNHGFSLKQTFNQLTEEQQNWFLYGTAEAIRHNPYTRAEDIPSPNSNEWEGVMTNLRRRYFQTNSEGMRFFFRNYMGEIPCSSCNSQRLKPAALSVLIGERTISSLMDMSVEDLFEFMGAITLTPKEKEIAKLVIKEICERLNFLRNVGLNYLCLSRRAGGLSGGEFQRIRLATQIGAGLTGVLYVLDEPSIGLHQRDNLRLIDTLIKLRDLGNTLIVVEHDEDTIRTADYIVDIGPGAGKEGGEILFSGTYDELLKSPKSITAQYLNKTKEIKVPEQRRIFDNQKILSIVGAKENNLKDVTISFPLGKLICITGVSGSGKSSLMNDILHKALMRHFYKSKERPGVHDKIEGLEHIDKVITIDQSPIGRTPRSNPATYTNVFTPIRDLFAQTREARIKGYKTGRFSFNVKGGRCEACEGDGVTKIEMHFLSDVYVTCDVCKGKRYNSQTLEVHYKGYTISDVLHLTVSEALTVFENIPAIASKLKTLDEVGLGYIQLGQSATTLSGGEAQRIKLAKELSKRSTGKTLYLLDEPTTGLHFADIQHLLVVLNTLVDSGNTVIVIEHNLDVIKTADHIIDMGPEGGNGGGELIAEGTPEEVAAVERSYTGKFLRPLLG